MSVQQDGQGDRYNKGKTNWNLVDLKAHEQMVRVLEFGAKKYSPDNWKRGMDWSIVLASLKRHIAAFEKGEDYDPDSGLLHMAHVACNAHFLTTYYRIYPQGDDRPKPWHNQLKIGLDIDGVLADFVQACAIKLNVPVAEFQPSHWNDPFIKHIFPELKKDMDFWIDMKPYLHGGDLPFEPYCYITSRTIDEEVTRSWLYRWGFPEMPLYSGVANKAEKCYELGLDIFVDDHFIHFHEINLNSNTLCYLMDRPWNRKYDVGVRRIKDLSDVLKHPFND